MVSVCVDPLMDWPRVQVLPLSQDAGIGSRNPGTLHRTIIFGAWMQLNELCSQDFCVFRYVGKCFHETYCSSLWDLPSLGRIHAMLAQNLISILEGCLAFVTIFVSVLIMP